MIKFIFSLICKQMSSGIPEAKVCWKYEWQEQQEQQVIIRRHRRGGLSRRRLTTLTIRRARTLNSTEWSGLFQVKKKEHESYHKIFHQNLMTAPTDDGKYICIYYFIKGWYSSGCNWWHKLTPKGEQTFNKWVNEMHERKKNHKQLDFQNGTGKSM